MLECPICSNPDFLESFTKGRAKSVSVPLPSRWRQGRLWGQSMPKTDGYEISTRAEQRSEFLRIVFDEEHFAERWRGFTVEVFGAESTGDLFFPKNPDGTVDSPPGPFFFIGSIFQGEDKDFHYHQYFACRITHKLSNIDLLAHWWPNHGMRFTMAGSLIPEETNDDIAIAAEMMEFFRVETRGEPKVTGKQIERAIQNLGDEVTQSAVAEEIGVTARTLQRWATRNGLQDWDAVKSRYSTKETIT